MQKIGIFFLLSFLFVVTEVQAQISYPQFSAIVLAFHHVYDSELKSQDAVMIINSGAITQDKDIWWNLPDRHASYSSYIEPNGKRIHYMFMLGGFTQIPGMTVEGVAMTLCHELGHGIGGRSFGKTSAALLVEIMFCKTLSKNL